MTPSERAMREIHGDTFTDEMDAMMEEFNTETAKPTLRQRAISVIYKLGDFLTKNPMALWTAVFIDGVILMSLAKYMGWF